MDENVKLARRLTQIYAKLLGERERLLSPPKYLRRLIPERAAFDEAAPEREKRIAEIGETLVHLAHVVRMLDPTFDEAAVKPVRPKVQRDVPMPNGISGSALDIIRDADEPLAPSEIVEIMGERFGLDLSTPAKRQRYYDAINQAFSGYYKDDLIEHPSELPDNPGWRRRWSWKHKAS